MSVTVVRVTIAAKMTMTILLTMRSISLNLDGGSREFRTSRVSLPVYATTPRISPVFLSTEPLNRKFVASNGMSGASWGRSVPSNV